MRVLMLGWELPPHNSGGLGVACLQLSKALAEAGADIDFILPHHQGHRFDFMRVTSALSSGVSSVVAGSAYDSYRYMLDDGSFFEVNIHDQQAAYAQMVGRLIDTMEFDIIHAHDWLTFRAALLARQKKNVPLVLHIHSIERDRAGGHHGNPWVREIEATSMLLADHIIAISERTKRMIVEDYHIPADKIEVIYNGLDASAVEPLDEQNAYRYLEELKSAGWKVVANIGRLTIQKGLTHLVEVAAAVLKNQPKTVFLLVGDGEQRDELIELAAERGVSRNIIFTGFQRGKNWRDAYAIADLFMMPSVSEPFGLTPLEAAAYSTPALVSKQSGVAEIFKNCLKVDYWDVNEMANQVVAVLRSSALQSELADKAHQEFQQLGWNSAARTIMDRYQEFTQRVPA